MGQVTIIAVIVVLFLLILISGKNKKNDTKALAVSAILVALGTALGYITLFKMPLWFTISCIGGYILSVVGVIILVRFFMYNFDLDDNNDHEH